MAREKRMHKMHTKASNAVAYVVLTLISIIWLVPFICLILQSFRGYESEFGGMVGYLVPKKFTLESYKFLFDGSSRFFKLYKNTLIISS